MKNKGINRRQFLRRLSGATAAAVGFPYIVQSSVLGQSGMTLPSERVVIGCIGVGSQGTANMNEFLGYQDVQIIAVCDVEKGSSLYYDGQTYGLDNAREAVNKYYGERRRITGLGGCQGYSDFREVLARTDVDAVVVSTPDHWHAVISALAAKDGKDIYCEKPLANSVLEGREVSDAVSRYGRILQTGSCQRSDDNVRFACELVRNGRIGKLQTIRVNLPTDEPYHKQVRDMARPHPDMYPPRSLNYDMWLGPAPYVAYTEKRCHFWWRYIFDYGGGEITDGGADLIDIAQLGNGTDETGPVEISANGKSLPFGLFDVFLDYEFELKYANGVRLIGSDKGTRGVKFEGDEGWIFINVPSGKLEAEPESLLKEVIRSDEIQLGRSKGHIRNFLDSVKARKESMAPAEVGHRTASICHLVNIALQTNVNLEWNPRLERIMNNYNADRMLSRTCRSPWHI